MYLDEIAQEIAAELDPGLLPDEAGVARLLRSYAVLARVKGIDVTREDIHDAWAAWMADEDPQHNALRPYADLDPGTRREDEPFVTAVRTVASRLAN